MGLIADVGVVFAKTDPSVVARGITAFLVPFDLPGVTISPVIMAGWKPQPRPPYFLMRYVFPKINVLEERGRGSIS